MPKAKNKKTMKRKSVRKKVSHVQKVVHEVKPHSEAVVRQDANMQALIANFIGLQKVLTNLAVKLNDVSSKTAKLLDLFEISAKSLADKNFDFMGGSNKAVENKLDNLLDQNKIIARGLTLMHDRVAQEQMPTSSPTNAPVLEKGATNFMPPSPTSQRGMFQQNQNAHQQQSQNLPGYQKSISSRTPEQIEEPSQPIER